MTPKTKKFLWIFSAGTAGILSLLVSEIPIPEDIRAELLQHTSETVLTLIILINPIILLIVFTLIGLFLQPKTTLKTPVFDKLSSISTDAIDYKLISYGVVGGILAGCLITLWTYLFTPYLPDEILNLNENIKLSVLTRLLYGGITEEVLLRFGLMTLLVWLFLKYRQADVSYWMAIFISSLLFGAGHLPVVYSVTENVESPLILYIIFGNSLGGIIFGWLYWKKGLESAMIAHIFTHLIMLIFQ